MNAPEGIICCVQNVHVREMIARIQWLVKMRWLFIAIVLLVGVLALFDYMPGQIDGRYFLGVGIALTVVNLFFQRQVVRINETCVNEQELREQCLGKVFSDYIGLAIITYALGTIETPVVFLILPNVVISTLFLERRQSLFVVTIGAAIMLLPLLLEIIGVLPGIDIYGGGIKATIMSNELYVIGYTLLFLFVVFFVWYLVSEITDSLIQDELELEDSYNEIVHMDEVKSKAIVQGTHELKAPLAAIKSYVFTLRDGYAGELPEKAQGIVIRIGERCDRLLNKVTDIIRLSNLRTYVYTGEQFSPINLHEALSREVELAAEAGKSRDIRVETDIQTEEAPYVNATEEHLQTLIGNALSNAVNYSAEGGVVNVRLWRNRNEAWLQIQDYGIGIAKEMLPRIFEEHFRTKRAAEHYAAGTGLGMPIIKETARLIDATFDIESEEGKGTRVTLIFKLIEKGA